MELPDELYDVINDVTELAADWYSERDREPDEELAKLRQWLAENRPLAPGQVYAHETGGYIKVIDIEDGQVAYWRVFQNSNREVQVAKAVEFPGLMKFWGMYLVVKD